MTVDLLDQPIVDPSEWSSREPKNIKDAGNKYENTNTRKTAYFSDE